MSNEIPKDPHMLVSYINMMLRDQCHSLAEFCEDKHADIDDIVRRLSDAGYEYNEKINQFR